jgi:DNA polymerase-4
MADKISNLISRRIIHTDMDAFYTSVEQRDFPELKGKPLAVGGGTRGVVAAASYEARKFGVFSAMPSVIAKRKCPDLIFMPPRFKVYKEVSEQIMTIFKKYTPLVEPLSLDEAFLDITENILGFSSARVTAMAIKQDIYETTGLTASAGVSFNKFLAKMASGENKPDGLTVITPEKGPEYISQLAIEKFFGIGKKTAEKMRILGIFSGKDLILKSEQELSRHFGKSGRHFYKMVRLEDDRAVKPNRLRKSIGEERTFETDIDSYGLIMMQLNEIVKHLEKYLKEKHIMGRTITLKIKYKDFTQKTRSKSLTKYTNQAIKIKSVVKALVDQAPIEKAVRLLGVSISNLDNQEENKTNGNQIELSF